jgi:hypothetical protein
VALASYLWEHVGGNMVEFIGFVSFVQEECRFSNVSPCKPYIPCNAMDDFQHRGHSIFLYGGIVAKCASDTSRFEMTIIVGVHIFFKICALSNIPFMLWEVQILFCTLVYILQ